MASANDSVAADLASAPLAPAPLVKQTTETSPAPKSPADVVDTPPPPPAVVPPLSAPADAPPPNGTEYDNKELGRQISELLGKVPNGSSAVIHSMLAQAIGLAMQNVVAQQQQMLALSNAIASRALKHLAENEPKDALVEVTQLIHASNPATTLEALARLVPGIIPTPAPAVDKTTEKKTDA